MPRRKPVEERKYKSWLVTDFVTLGSALTHAFSSCAWARPRRTEAEGGDTEQVEGGFCPSRRGTGVSDLSAETARSRRPAGLLPIRRLHRQEDPQWRAVRTDPMDQHLFSAASDLLGRRDRRRAVADLRISYRGYRGVDSERPVATTFSPTQPIGTSIASPIRFTRRISSRCVTPSIWPIPGPLSTWSTKASTRKSTRRNNAYATACLVFSARLRSLASRCRLRRRIDFGVISTSSSSSI